VSQWLSVKNFEKFQHYSHRNPPWIKLYNDVLADYAFTCLQDASRYHLIGIWLLASRTGNKIPYDAKWIEKQLQASIKVDLDALIDAGFLTLHGDVLAPHASNTLAPSASTSREEKSREETEKSRAETLVRRVRIAPFVRFWSVYPHKIGKRAAEKAWDASIKRGNDPRRPSIG
jgi:hypothetical protein